MLVTFSAEYSTVTSGLIDPDSTITICISLGDVECTLCRIRGLEPETHTRMIVIGPESISPTYGLTLWNSGATCRVVCVPGRAEVDTVVQVDSALVDHIHVGVTIGDLDGT